MGTWNNNNRGYNNGGYNNGGYNNGGYNNGGYNNGGYNNGGYNNGGYNQRPQKKRSGCKSKRYVPKTGPNAGQDMIITTGWGVSKKGGLVTFKCNTTHKSVDTGKGWLGSIVITVTHQATKQQQTYWGMMHAQSGKVVIPALSMVLNPYKNYCGTYIKRRR